MLHFESRISDSYPVFFEDRIRIWLSRRFDPVQVFSRGWDPDTGQIHPDPQPCCYLAVELTHPLG